MTVVLNVWMYVVGLLNLSIDSCFSSSISSSPAQIGVDIIQSTDINYWDEAVATYVGSLEGPFGDTGNGVLLYGLAEKLCQHFNTCDNDNDDDDGANLSSVNHRVMTYFEKGQSALRIGSCFEANGHRNRLVSYMTIPIIQGLLYYTDAMDTSTDIENNNMASARAYLSALLPLVHACDSNGAEHIEETFLAESTISSASTGAATADGSTLGQKASLIIETLYEQDIYGCLGISCTDLGQLHGVDLCFQEDSNTSPPSPVPPPSDGENGTTTTMSPSPAVIITPGPSTRVEDDNGTEPSQESSTTSLRLIVEPWRVLTIVGLAILTCTTNYL